MSFMEIQKSVENIVDRSCRGFSSLPARRFFVHKIVLWGVMFSPLYIAEAYGVVTATSPVPKFLSDFLFSVTNIGWILGVPILSSIMVSGLFCLIGADKLKQVAIDDARRAPGTVSAIWFFLGVFFMTIDVPNGIRAAHTFIIMAVVLGFLHFVFWGIAEQHSNSSGNNKTSH